MKNHVPLRLIWPPTRSAASGPITLLLQRFVACCFVLWRASRPHFACAFQASDLRRQIEREETQLADLRREQNQYSAVLTKPENAGTFAYSVFINQIIARRA